MSKELGIHDALESHFMVDFIAGKANPRMNGKLFEDKEASLDKTPIAFSPEAQALMDAGLALWRYYHAQPNANPNASLYDIRMHFQGVNAKGRMNATSTDEEYTRLIGALRAARKHLGDTKIAPKVYAYGFLME